MDNKDKEIGRKLLADARKGETGNPGMKALLDKMEKVIEAGGTDKVNSRDLLPPATDRLNKYAADYVTYAAKTLGVDDPKALPEIVVGDKYSIAALDTAALSGNLFGAYFPALNILYVRDDVANYIERDNVIAQSVIVHELTHYVAYKSGLDAMATNMEELQHIRDVGQYKAEKHAYTVQARWLWEIHKTNPRLFPAMSYHNLLQNTHDKEFSTLSWLGGYVDDEPTVNWDEYWQGRALADDMFSDDPNLSIDAYKRIYSDDHDVAMAQYDALVSSGRYTGGTKGRAEFEAHLKTRGKPKSALSTLYDTLRGTRYVLHQMDDVSAIMIAEGECSTHDEYVEAFQYLLNRGLVWQLQGWYGRRAKELIDSGEIVRPIAGEAQNV